MKFQKDSVFWQKTQKFAPSSPNSDEVTQTTKIIFLQDLKLYNFNQFLLS